MRLGTWEKWEGGKGKKGQDRIAIVIACTFLEDCGSEVPLMG